MLYSTSHMSISIYATPGAYTVYVAPAVVIQLPSTKRSQQQQKKAEENSGQNLLKNTDHFCCFLQIYSLQLQLDSRQLIKMSDKCWGGKLRRRRRRVGQICLEEKPCMSNPKIKYDLYAVLFNASTC